MSGQDVAGDMAAALLTWSRDLGPRALALAVAEVEAEQATPETLGDILRDLERRRELAMRREAIDLEQAMVALLESDTATAGLALGFQALASASNWTDHMEAS